MTRPTSDPAAQPDPRARFTIPTSMPAEVTRDVLILAGVEGLGMLGLTMLMVAKLIPLWGFLAGTGVLTAVFVARIVVISKKGQAQLRARQLDAMRAAGYTPIDPADTPAMMRAFAPFAGAGVLKGGPKSLKLAADLTTQSGREVRLGLHQHTVSTGKSSTTFTHWAAATPCPAPWPAISISGENLGTKIASMLGAKDIELDDPEFNKAWHVRALSKDRSASAPDFALVLLSPEVQRFLLPASRDQHRAESWWIGSGQVVCVRMVTGTPKKPTFVPQDVIDRLDGFMALVPPELDAWAR
jgi:hypothetical protein